MISAHNLSRTFNGVQAVEGVSFEISEGKLFALLGPNGAGKTTTVRLLLGLIAPSAGTAKVAGFELGRDAQSNNSIRAACGLLTETPGFYDRISAWENLLFFASLYPIPKSQIKDRVEHYLKFMNLWDRRGSLVGTYSKGMKQKLAIIRSVFHEPKVIFMDEPTAGLDPEASLSVREMILKLKGEGRTIVVCTHNLDEAARLADIVGIIRQRLLVCDTLANLQSGSGADVRVEIELIEPAEKYIALIEKFPFVKKAEAASRALLSEVSEPERNIPSIVKALVENGAQIMTVRPKTDDLEKIYLRCIREGERG